MPTPQKDSSGFDAFFKAVTSSGKFDKTPDQNDIDPSIASLESSLKEMEAWVAKAADLMAVFDKEFGNQKSTPLPPLSGGHEPNTSGTGAPPKTGNAKDEEGKMAVEVQRFTRVEGKPYGFEAVAGMDDLKKELTDNFIEPIRFKFLVERLRREKTDAAIISSSWGTKNPENEVDSSQAQNDGGLEKGNWETPIPLPLSGISLSQGSNTALLERLYTAYEKFKISIPTGMLFYGPPGTGKTFITKKLAEELGCGFISKNMGEFGSSYLHQTTKNIRDFFEWAKKAAESEPIILFLDEIDSLVSARTDRVDANKAEEVSQFLQEFNSLEEAPNLIVIAATNRPDHLDPAILRSWRLDKKIYLWPPDATARRELFRMYIEKKWRPSEKLDYDELARLTDGYVSADIEAICDEVARDASQRILDLVDDVHKGKKLPKDFDKTEITMSSIRQAIIDMPSSLKMVDMSIYTSWLEKLK